MAFCSRTPSALAKAVPRSITLVEQSDLRGPFYSGTFPPIQEVSEAASPVTLYVEKLDISCRWQNRMRRN